MPKNTLLLKNSLIISPSGNLYGSELVLLEFLKETKKLYTVYVPLKSELYSKLSSIKHNHSIKNFSNLYLLYSILLLKLLFTKRNLYLNEGGHIRYIKVLAKLLPFRKFFVHIRLLEDCANNRLKSLPKNIRIITVSDFLREKIDGKDVKVILDPYTLSNFHKTIKTNAQATGQSKGIRIGIIGRITATKGLDSLYPILDIFEKEKQIKVNLLFFGSYNSNDVWANQFMLKIKKYTWIKHEFAGFVSDKNTIYSNVDMVLHLNKVEALGRIIFEAIDFEIPILTFNAGGCGELLKKLELNNFLIPVDGQWPEAFKAKIIKYTVNYPFNAIQKAKEIIAKEFSAALYVSKLETIIRG